MTVTQDRLPEHRTLIADRRRHSRIEAALPASVRPLDRLSNQTSAMIGHTVDISDGGALLRLPRPLFLAQGTRVRIGIGPTPDHPARLIRSAREGTVVRCLAHGEIQHAAVQFDAASPLAAAG
ncbi:MAG: PilZ domain-containing protein [Planctomycetota bacterium]